MNRFLLLFITLLLFGAPPHASAQIGGPSGSGQWSGVIQTPIVPVAAANLPNGKVLTWSAYDRFSFGGNRGKTYTAIFDPATNSSQQMLVTNTQHDMFCPGTSVLADGRIMVTGGSSSNKTSIYDPSLNQWTSGAATIKPRGYHAMVTLANGDVFTIGGSWSGGAGNKHGEIYENGSWRLLSGVPVDVILDGATDPAGVTKNDNFPWLWTAPNGKIFHAGPSSNMHWIDPTGNGSYTNAGARGDDVFAYAGTTVMFDEGKILKTGGAASYGDGRAASPNSYIIDINTNQAQVERVQNLTYSRNKHNVVVLPTGEVLAIGGLGVAREFSDQNSRLVPELFDPVSKTWRSLAPMVTPRNYHSIALLLPDGRVMAAGGGLCGGCTVNHPDAEIFSPPYLFNSNGTVASRPSITNTPGQFGNNTQQTVSTNTAVSYFSLVRYNVATHSTNNDQRRIRVTTTALGNNSYRLNIPSENVLPPGPYMLFAVNANGTPSVASVVQVEAAPPPPPVNPGGTGLTGNYFNNKDFTAAAFNRVDPSIDFNWGTGSPASNMGADTYSIRWEGTVVAPYSGNFTFFSETDDGVRLWVDGQLIIDKWIPQAPTEWSGSIALTAGVPVSIKMEYYEDGGGAVAKLRWNGPFTNKQIISANYLFPQGTTYSPQDPIAVLSATPVNGLAPLPVTFDASASSDPDGTIASYSWTFGDGSTGTGVNASHTYTQLGSYTARLTVTDQAGNTHTATKVISVNAPCDALDLPAYEFKSYTTGQDFGTAQIQSSDQSVLLTGNAWKYIDYNYTITPNTVLSFEFKSTVEPELGAITMDNDNGINNERIFHLYGFQNTTSLGIIQDYLNYTPGGFKQYEIPVGQYYTGAMNKIVFLADHDASPMNGNAFFKSVRVYERDACSDQAPVASFTATPTSGAAPLAVNFDANASSDPFGTIATYAWDFGDGTTASGVTASHTYTQVGSFTAQLTVTDQGGNSNTTDKTITVSPANTAPVAALTATPTNGEAPLPVNFNGSGSTDDKGITAYNWNFGDGTNGTGAIVSHTYNTAGTYTATLTVSDQEGLTDSKTVSITVTVPVPVNIAPVASISATPTSGDAPLPVSFDGNGSTDDKGVTSYSWAFGDGNTGSGATVSHTYALAGNYTASLTVSDQEGLTDTKTIIITVNEPLTGDCFIADVDNRLWIEAENFSAALPGTGNASASSWISYSDPSAANGSALRAEPNDGVFTGLSTNGPRLDYNLYFSTPGNYALYVRGAGPTGSDDSFHAGLNGNPLTTTSGYGMSVPPSWTWAEEANDGVDVILNIPNAGSYTLNLWMREDGVSLDKIYIFLVGDNGPSGTGEAESAQGDCGGAPSNQAPVPSFTATPPTGPAPLAVSFDANASTDDNGIASYAWDFGDGNTASGITASHSYTNVGQFTASLTVTDGEGLSATSTQIIQVENPDADNCFAEVNGEVVIEAENFSRLSPGTGNASASTWSLISDANASGGQALEAGPNTGVWTGLNTNGPRLDYNIDFSETGIYRIYILTSAPGSNDDSYHVGLDGNSVSSNSGWGMGLNGPWAWADYANEDDFVEVNVASVGKHTFNVWMREDGVQIDKIILSKTNYPTGQGPAQSGQSPCSGEANQAPVASFSATPSSGFAPLDVSIDASASTDADGSISSYAWNFGDGTTGNGQSLSHTYTSVGSFTLTLTVTDNEGLSNQSSRTITVSPNGTGPLCHQESAGIVVMEAENYSATSSGTGNAVGSSWQKINDANTSNGEAVKAMPNTGVYTGLNLNGPRLDYDITFQTAGTYRVYIRANGPAGTDDSFHAGLNGVSTTNASAYGMGYTGTWFWAQEANEDPFVEVVVPSTGQHTFNIWMREDGVEIDKIVLKVQPGTPSGQGPTESILAECADQNFTNEAFSVQEEGGNADLNWGNFFEEFKDSYVLERSVDGMTYQQIEAEEISVDKLRNEHTDPNIHQYDVNRIFYRLRIKDGYGRTRKEKAGVLNLRTSFVSFSMKAYPNPASEKLNVEYDNSSGQSLSLKVMSALGQTVHTANIDGQESHGIIKLDVEKFTQGIYFVQLTDGETSQVIRILVE